MTRPGGARSVLVVAALLGLAGCTSGATGSLSIPATNAASASLLPTSADALPPMDPDQLHQLLTELKGTPVVLNFWASWCEPCKTETPLLVAAHRRLGAQVQFVGVDLQDSAAGARRFIAQQDITYPSVFDPSAAIGTAYSLLGPPGTFFYDAAGTLVASSPGELSAADLQRNLQRIGG
ncbi:MAG TPA: TlpA disulfide reductase family protein [Actinomycetota bacterium]|nr:TlpA disulfide reductase family protein [Actinomycetota bacterium]